jgi:hypothetical protein
MLKFDGTIYFTVPDFIATPLFELGATFSSLHIVCSDDGVLVST